jgi:hypothetical protein
MNQPLVVNLPHQLGKDEARRRIAGSTGKLVDHIPGGAADVQSSWEGDRLNLTVTAMGQQVAAHIDIEEKFVRLEMLLPAFLAMFGSTITGFLEKKGTELLEDKRA